MNTVAASRVKQNFGEILALAALAPQGIERHGKLVAALVPPDWLARQSSFDERRAVGADLAITPLQAEGQDKPQQPT